MLGVMGLVTVKPRSQQTNLTELNCLFVRTAANQLRDAVARDQ